MNTTRLRIRDVPVAATPGTVTMQTAIIYTRVSTSKQEENTSLESQLEDCHAYAKENGFTVLDTFSEVYSGGELYNRPQLNEARNLIRARRVDALILTAVDRLSRDLAHLAIVSEECKRADVQLLFVTKKFDQTPEGKLLQSLDGYLAEVERSKLKDRTQRGIRQKLESGQFIRMGGDIFGYRFSPEKNQREICESEAATVRNIFNWYLREQMSAISIAIRLNASGVLTPQASKGVGHVAKGWYSRTINLILRREEYSGKTFAGKVKIEITQSKEGTSRHLARK